MKNCTILLLFISSFSFGQTYDLLPDTCTHCSFVYSDFTYTLMEGHYSLYPENDTIYQGQSYMKVPLEDASNDSLFAVRQVGNKLYGILEGDTVNQYLIQDWETPVGDTIPTLYSTLFMYSAVVKSEDSLLLNDGSYHHFRELLGIGFYENGVFNQNMQWELIWNERGLCPNVPNTGNAQHGGILYNAPLQILSVIPYSQPNPHTPDPRYDLNQYVNSCIFTGVFNNLPENNFETFTIYPNPTSGLIKLSDFDFEINEIQLLDTKGNILLNKLSSEASLDLSSFENGVYFLRIKSSENIFHQTKIIKAE